MNAVLLHICRVMVFLTGLVMGLPAFSQTIRVEVSREVMLPGETFQVHYIIDQPDEIRDFSVKQAKGLKLIDSFKVTSLNTSSFTYVQILSPMESGRLVVPVATAVINGKQVRSPDKQITVQNRGAGKDAVTDQSVLFLGETPEEKLKENFFLTASVSKKECFLGENIMAEYKVYNRLNASSSVTKRPSFPGFSILEMADQYSKAPDVEFVGQEAFFTHLLRKVHLFPLQPGNFKLDEAEVETEVHFKKQKAESHSSSGLREYYEQNRRPPQEDLVYRAVLRSPMPEVIVKPLPEKGKPENFSGAVGKFSMDIQVKDDSNARQKSFIVSITGTGNFPLVNAPAIEWPQGLRYRYKGSREILDYKNYPLSGQKQFTWSLSFSGKQITIPAFRFVYFDPETGKYEEISSGDVVLENTGNELHLSNLQQPKNFGSQGKFFRILLVGLVAMAIVLILLVNHLKRKAKSTAEEKAEQVPDILMKAEDALHNNNISLFYSEALNYMGQIAGKYQAGELSVYRKEAIRQNLIASGYPEAKTELFMETFESIMLNRYRPDCDAGTERELLEKLKMLKS